jgi:hypothetical protein
MSQLILAGTARPVLLPSTPFTSAQALEAGLNRWALTQAVAAGEVRRVLTDVYVVHSTADSLATRAQAARLVLGEHAVVVDRSAAWLWGVDVLRVGELETCPRLETYVLRGHKRVTRREVGGGQRDLVPEDITALAGVRVTTPERTCLDLACRLGAYEALAALDAFARIHGITTFDLMHLLPRFRRRRGVVQARRLVPLLDGRVESSGESFTRLAIVNANLPLPRPQHWVTDRGQPIYRLDLAYPDQKVCIEYDGQEHHTTEERKEADRCRRGWLRDHGWLVIVVTKDDFVGAALDAWIGQLRSELAARTRRTAPRSD